MSTTLRRLTWEDIKDLPESGAKRTELVDGELIVSPAASIRHQRICGRLAAKLSEFVEQRRLGQFFTHPVHVILNEHVHYEPDLCYVANERRTIIGELYISGAPDLIIEVISESNRSHDTVVKFNDYQRYGIKEYWLVDPRENHIRVFTLEGRTYQALGIYAPGERVQSRTFVGLDLDPTNVLLD
jgi:Uma2 family endonuclease